MTSPTNGTQQVRASHDPYLSTFSFCFWRVSGLTLNHFSIHSHLPIQPIQNVNTLPSQLPRVPTARHPTGFAVAARMARYKASELNGNMVAARNVPMNRPRSPSPSSHSILASLFLEKISDKAAALFCKNSAHDLCLGVHEGRGEDRETSLRVGSSIDHFADL